MIIERQQKPKVITLTDAAAERVRAIVEKSDHELVGVRIGVDKGGCAGMTYTMEYAEKIEELDEVIEEKGVTVLVDPRAVLFLVGTEMDYRRDRFSSGFQFSNPNATDACGCGESFTLVPSVHADA